MGDSDADGDVLPAGASVSGQVVSASAGQVVSRGPYRKNGGAHLKDWRVDPPPSIVALVAQVEGKFSDVWVGDSSLQAELSTRLCSNVRASGLYGRVANLLSRDASGCFVVGFALVDSWHFLDPSDLSDCPSGSPLDLMVEHFRADRHGRSHLGFVSNNIIDCALLLEPVACSPSDLSRLKVDSLPGPFKDSIVESCLSSQVVDSVSLQAVVSSWLVENTLQSDLVLPAFLDSRYACLVASGAWDSDLSCVISRDKRRSRLHPSLPPCALENVYLSSTVPRPGPVVFDHDDSSDELVRTDKRSRYGCLSTFSPHHLVRALQVDKYLKVSGSIEPVGRATLRLFFVFS